MARSVKQKEINFLTVLTGRSTKKKLDPRSLIMPAVLLLIILAGVGIFALFTVDTQQVEAQSNSIREYLNAPETNQQLNEAAALQTQASAMQSRADAASDPMVNLAGYPDLSSENYRQLWAYAGANIELTTLSFDRTSGILSFTASSDYVLSIPTFIAQLRSSGIFSDITYSGYAGNAAVTQIATSTNRTSSSDANASSTSSYSSYTSVSSTSYTGTTYQAPLYAFSVECSVKPPDTSAQQDTPTAEETPVEQGGEG